MLRVALGRVLSLTPNISTLTQLRWAKDSTFLKGLEVDPQAEENTPIALQELLAKVQKDIPEGVAYRKHVEKYCDTFLKIINEAPTQSDAEKVLGRQFEQIQEDVEAEKALIDNMAEWKPWDVPPNHSTSLFAELKDIPKNVKAYREFQDALSSRKREP
jgi:hypothetical protein